MLLSTQLAYGQTNHTRAGDREDQTYAEEINQSTIDVMAVPNPTGIPSTITDAVTPQDTSDLETIYDTGNLPTECVGEFCDTYNDSLTQYGDLQPDNDMMAVVSGQGSVTNGIGGQYADCEPGDTPVDPVLRGPGSTYTCDSGSSPELETLSCEVILQPTIDIDYVYDCIIENSGIGSLPNGLSGYLYEDPYDLSWHGSPPSDCIFYNSIEDFELRNGRNGNIFFNGGEDRFRGSFYLATQYICSGFHGNPVGGVTGLNRAAFVVASSNSANGILNGAGVCQTLEDTCERLTSTCVVESTSGTVIEQCFIGEHGRTVQSACSQIALYEGDPSIVYDCLTSKTYRGAGKGFSEDLSNCISYINNETTYRCSIDLTGGEVEPLSCTQTLEYTFEDQYSYKCKHYGPGQQVSCFLSDIPGEEDCSHYIDQGLSLISTACNKRNVARACIRTLQVYGGNETEWISDKSCTLLANEASCAYQNETCIANSIGNDGYVCEVGHKIVDVPEEKTCAVTSTTQTSTRYIYSAQSSINPEAFDCVDQGYIYICLTQHPSITPLAVIEEVQNIQTNESACATLQADNDCELKSTVCAVPLIEVVMSDGTQEEYCPQSQRTFECSASVAVDSCDIPTGCSFVNDVCLITNEDGSCKLTQKRYSCAYEGECIRREASYECTTEIASLTPSQTVHTFVSKEWVGNCPNLSQCSVETTCDTENETRTLDGQNFTENCWSRTLTGSCTVGADPLGCNPPPGCQLDREFCAQGALGNNCRKLERTYKCENTSGTPAYGDCVAGDTECLKSAYVCDTGLIRTPEINNCYLNLVHTIDKDYEYLTTSEFDWQQEVFVPSPALTLIQSDNQCNQTGKECIKASIPPTLLFQCEIGYRESIEQKVCTRERQIVTDLDYIYKAAQIWDGSRFVGQGGYDQIISSFTSSDCKQTSKTCTTTSPGVFTDYSCEVGTDFNVTEKTCNIVADVEVSVYPHYYADTNWNGSSHVNSSQRNALRSAGVCTERGSTCLTPSPGVFTTYSCQVGERNTTTRVDDVCTYKKKIIVDTDYYYKAISAWNGSSIVRSTALNKLLTTPSCDQKSKTCITPSPGVFTNYTCDIGYKIDTTKGNCTRTRKVTVDADYRYVGYENWNGSSFVRDSSLTNLYAQRWTKGCVRESRVATKTSTNMKSFYECESGTLTYSSEQTCNVPLNVSIVTTNRYNYRVQEMRDGGQFSMAGCGFSGYEYIQTCPRWKSFCRDYIFDESSFWIKYNCPVPMSVSGAVYLGSSVSYREVDSLDESACSAPIGASKPLKSETCIEGPSTKTISGKQVTRSCWKWKRTYGSTNNETISTCSVPSGFKLVSSTGINLGVGTSSWVDHKVYTKTETNPANPFNTYMCTTGYYFNGAGSKISKSCSQPSGSTLMNNTCIYHDGNGTCRMWRRSYKVPDPDPSGGKTQYKEIWKCENTVSGATLIETVREIETNTINNANCPYVKDNDCSVSSGWTCIEPGEARTINGLSVYQSCWKWTQQYTCNRRTDTNTCNVPANSTLTNTQCLWSDSACRLERRTYKVTLNDPSGGCHKWEYKFLCEHQTAGAGTPYDTDKRLESESWDWGNCAVKDNSDYTYTGTQWCIEGPATRIIDGLSVTRNCWKYGRSYDYLHTVRTDTCQVLQASLSRGEKPIQHAGLDIISTDLQDLIPDFTLPNLINQTHTLHTAAAPGDDFVILAQTTEDDVRTGELIEETCLEYTSSGQCQLWQRRYRVEEVDPSGGCHKRRFEYHCTRDVSGAGTPFEYDRKLTTNDWDTSACDVHEANSICEKIESVCTETASIRTINGLKVNRSCWKIRRKYRCSAPFSVDTCNVPAAAVLPPQETCLERDQYNNCIRTRYDYQITGEDPSGGCHRWDYAYFCEKPVSGVTPFRIDEHIQSEKIVLTGCSGGESSVRCDNSAYVCSQGRETRQVGGLSLNRACWGWERIQDCYIREPIDTCDIPANAELNEPTGGRCIWVDVFGECKLRQFDYTVYLPDPSGGCQTYQYEHRCENKKGNLPINEIFYEVTNREWVSEGDCRTDCEFKQESCVDLVSPATFNSGGDDYSYSVSGSENRASVTSASDVSSVADNTGYGIIIDGRARFVVTKSALPLKPGHTYKISVDILEDKPSNKAGDNPVLLQFRGLNASYQSTFAKSYSQSATNTLSHFVVTWTASSNPNGQYLRAAILFNNLGGPGDHNARYKVYNFRFEKLLHPSDTTRTVDGMEISETCWRRERAYECTIVTPYDDCSVPPTCVEQSDICEDAFEDGVCARLEHYYECDKDNGPVCIKTARNFECIRPEGHADPTRVTYPAIDSYSGSCSTLDGNPECEYISEECRSPLEYVSHGFWSLGLWKDIFADIPPPCYEKVKTYACKVYEPANDCNVNGQCVLASQTCIETDANGECRRYSRNYACPNPDGPSECSQELVTYQCDNTQTGSVGNPVTGGTGGVWESSCENNETSSCEQSAQVCMEPSETRLIDGVPVFAECWRYERTYICEAGRVSYDDCSVPLGCTLKDTECLYYGPVTGECLQVTKVYNCPGQIITVPTEGAPQSQSVLNKQIQAQSQVANTSKDVAVKTEGLGGVDVCEAVQACYGENCTSVEGDTNSSIPDELAAMYAVDQAVNDRDQNLRFFSGQGLKCSKLFAGRNCCKNTGILTNLFGCSQNEKDLAAKRSEGNCIYVGSYCSTKSIFGCIKRKETHCCFKGKMAKLVQEQGRKQLNMDFGSAKSPNCAGFTVETFKRLDLGKMDFSAIYNDMVQGLNLENEDEMRARFQQSIGGMTGSSDWMDNPTGNGG
ncbi:MAG: hypothetical protein COA43_00705 [Robiginitomaculum sp.]|nr:MAG: hypothetical protein COA43_00705 [Robiginitomaculum sp.]